MIYINFDGLLGLLNLRAMERDPLNFKKITMGEVADATGVARKILSRVKNNPTYPLSSEHVGKLCEYFFHKLLPLKLPERSEELLMEFVITSLIEVYPDDSKYQLRKEDMPNNDDYSRLIGHSRPSNLWTMYAISRNLPAKESIGKFGLFTFLFEKEEEVEHKRRHRWDHMTKKPDDKK